MNATTFLVIIGVFLPLISGKNEAVDGKKKDDQGVYLPLVLTNDAVTDGKGKKNDKFIKSGTTRSSSSYTLYPENSYDSEYLRDYKLMINSLIGPTKDSVNLVNTAMRLGKEHRTASELFGRFQLRIPECWQMDMDGPHMKEIKVLQDEDSNYVTLKENTKEGGLYVEKSTRSRTSFEYERTFFERLDPSNPYFPRMICYMPTPGREHRISLITEFIPGRESHLMAARANQAQLKSMVKQLFESIVDLHRMGYIHADIKPGNVLVTDDFKVKLIDFGMATRVGQAKKYRGNPYIRAPELHDMCPGHVDVGIDWWAFGATISIWYYYHYKSQSHYFKSFTAFLRQDRILTTNEAREYFQVDSSYTFTPFKWTGGRFQPGFFPSAFESDVRSFIALFLTIDPELRTFDSRRLQDLVRNHPYFTQQQQQ